MEQTKDYRMDMCEGPLFSKIVLFSVPLMLSGILQLLFNAADIMVIGRFASQEALAALGATCTLCGLILNLFMGISIGVNVLAARYYGAQDRKMTSRTTHTALFISFIGGTFLAIIGILISPTLLEWTKVPAEIMDLSALYMKIYCMGMPFIVLFNFGSAILRAVGDTRNPMCYLIYAGFLNVILNLFFVICLHMDVDGVALATVISQALSAFLVIRNLHKTRDCCRFRFHALHVAPKILRDILWIGLPAGIQSAFFSISNVTIQSTVNSFGSTVIAANMAAIVIESIIYTGSFAYHQTAISFTSQNLGGGKFNRICTSFWYCMLLTTVINTVMGLTGVCFGPEILGFFSKDPAIIPYGMVRMKYLFTFYALCGMMDTVSGTLRGLGFSIQSAVVTMIGVCVLRVTWVFFIFPLNPILENLMISYPISWGLTAGANGIFLYFHLRKLKKQMVCAA